MISGEATKAEKKFAKDILGKNNDISKQLAKKFVTESGEEFLGKTSKNLRGMVRGILRYGVPSLVAFLGLANASLYAQSTEFSEDMDELKWKIERAKNDGNQSLDVQLLNSLDAVDAYFKVLERSTGEQNTQLLYTLKLMIYNELFRAWATGELTTPEDLMPDLGKSDKEYTPTSPEALRWRIFYNNPYISREMKRRFRSRP